MPVIYYVILSSLLFCIGLYGVLTRKNAVAILLCIEIMLNAANLNIIAFSRCWPEPARGTIFVLFVIGLAAAEAAVGLAIIISYYRKSEAIDLDNINLLKW
ncbi:MAG TPA: NADH-quinone oxidoreductase subunit NuoK [Candidatus Eremiobacteraeota bacterium]|nr:NADH-quinone oxidoreductase subunit NuoK [Candidatus Eremiobacteraeota bacterium]